jgi:hypothetical protein
MKRLALVALLLVSSSLVAAPAPVPKPQRKPERPAARQSSVTDGLDDLLIMKLGQVQGRQAARVQMWARLVQAAQAQAQPAQPPNADPPG